MWFAILMLSIDYTLSLAKKPIGFIELWFGPSHRIHFC
jgi:hypothetical protein